MLRIVRNDLVRMECDAIVNTANSEPIYSSGVDTAVYEAAGPEELLAERRKIGHVEEGEVFVTDAYRLPVKKIIHAVSPMYFDGNSGEEDKLRSCYKKSLKLATDIGMKSLAFPVISTGSFGYPISQGISIAIEEINEYLEDHDLLVYLVVFDKKASDESRKYVYELESFIEDNYVDAKSQFEYGLFSPETDLEKPMSAPMSQLMSQPMAHPMSQLEARSSYVAEDKQEKRHPGNIFSNVLGSVRKITEPKKKSEPGKGGSDRYVYAEEPVEAVEPYPVQFDIEPEHIDFDPDNDESFYELETKLNSRLKHLKDSFSDYLMYLIESRGMTPFEVYTNSVVTKKLFSKIKTNPDYHPSKEVALRLCVGARLNIDDSRDLLSRAGYTFSPCELYDLIFEFFIENEIYDIVEIAIQLEEHGLESFIDS